MQTDAHLYRITLLYRALIAQLRGARHCACAFWQAATRLARRPTRRVDRSPMIARPASPANSLTQHDNAKLEHVHAEEHEKELMLEIRRCIDHGPPQTAQNAVIHTKIYEAGVLTSTGPSIENWSRYTAGCICVTPRFSADNLDMGLAAHACVLTTTTEFFLSGMRSWSPTRDEHRLFTFAGLARTSGMLSERGLLQNEACRFTLLIGGVACMINNGDDAIWSGQQVYWAFRYLPPEPVHEHPSDWADHLDSRDCHPIQVRALPEPAPPGTMSRVFGRACTSARVGEPFAVRICSADM